MKGFLTPNQIKYVFFHLQQAVDLSPVNFLADIAYVFNPKQSSEKQIIFNLSDAFLDENNIRIIDGLPILFPLGNEKNLYSMQENKLVFHHDLLKTCFYLLSGYQEYKSDKLDHFGRFKFEESIQDRLNIIKKPIVNYVFEVIIKALTEFYRLRGIVLKPKKLFNDFAFFLTHDIDNIDYYTINHLLYKVKEIAGLVQPSYSFADNLKEIGHTTIELLKGKKKDNPNWNFTRLIQIEQSFRLRSAFYFLNRDQKNVDSKYSFEEHRLKPVFQQILRSNCEIGIHGTVNSATSLEHMKAIVNSLKKNAKTEISGGRQHRLIFKLPDSAIIHKNAGLKYDSTLCYAEHEGFRNSYCLPFKLYDFVNDKPIDIWQIPLNVMDVTLFHYRELNYDEVSNSVKELIKEIKKFGGVFTLLWHNNFFDEIKHPDIKKYYIRLLTEITLENPECLIGPEIIERC